LTFKVPRVSKIKKLSGSIVNQIAAGEVVIQPCSVIKELVENSFDAGARRVDIEFNGSGADELKVMDDGSGMEPEDLLLSIEPHATSKISSAADIYQVVSCGFRGEALASIAEVSQFEVVSRLQGSEAAHRLHRDKNGTYITSPASRAQGTTITMKHLFHNVPVRRRFLKSDRSETSHNLDILRKLALARPWIAMNVRHDERTCWDLPEEQQLEERVRGLLLFDKKCRFLPFEKEDGQLKVSGLVVSPPDHFGNGQKIYIFVNRRPIKDKSLNQALVRSFSSYIPERRFPGAVLFIDIDPEEVDVNIHPTKSEVRFREPDLIFKKVYAAVRDTLMDSAQEHDASDQSQTLVYKSSGLAKTVPMNRNYGGVYDNKPNPFGASESGESKGSGTAGSLFQPKIPDRHPEARPESFSSGNEFQSEKSSDEQLSHSGPEAPPTKSFQVDQLPTAYQILDRFIMIEREDRFDLMDQHAIHERILYNQLAHEDHARKNYASQGLLAPVSIDLPEALGELSETILEELNNMGFQVEIQSKEGNVLVHGLPDFLKIEKGLQILEEMLDDLAQNCPPNRDDLRRDILHSAACRSAIKAGDHLTPDELKGIVAAALTMDQHQGCCPHGRNAIWSISIAEANAMFNR
jgi:DNA mismatch repair protein MutL